jgi:hypothetical protein
LELNSLAWVEYPAQGKDIAAPGQQLTGIYRLEHDSSVAGITELAEGRACNAAGLPGLKGRPTTPLDWRA